VGMIALTSISKAKAKTGENDAIFASPYSSKGDLRGAFHIWQPIAAADEDSRMESYEYEQGESRLDCHDGEKYGKHAL
jgi:hypothetical protein